MLRSALVCLLMAFLTGTLFSQDKTVTYLYDAGAVPENKFIDIHHLTASLTIDPYDTLVKGSVVFNFLPILNNFDSVLFWSPDILYTNVEIPGLKIEYRKQGDNLIIKNLSPQGKALNGQYQLKMEYTSRPRYDLFFIGWNEPAVRPNKQIWAHRPFQRGWPTG